MTTADDGGASVVLDPTSADPARLPTFIIGGVRKGGTTTLWSHLDSHPDVGMATLKEPQFFTSAGMLSRGWAWYQPLFAGTEQCLVRGEGSTKYFEEPDSAAIIARALPDVRIVFCLRHPVQRIYSDYWYDRRFLSDLPDFDTFATSNHPLLETYIRRSRYALHLDRFYEVFDRGQIRVVLTEDLRTRATETAREVCRFIGVDPDVLPTVDPTARNMAAETRWTWLHRMLALHRREWTRWLPRRVAPAAWWVKQQILQLNSRPARYPSLNATTRAQLALLFDEDVRAVEVATGRRLDHWRS